MPWRSSRTGTSVLGGGLAALRELLRDDGIDDPLWFEVDKSRKAPKRVREALERGADRVLVWGGDGMVQRCVDVLAGSRRHHRDPPGRDREPLRHQPRHPR